MNLQGSQTAFVDGAKAKMFENYMNLQGSQTIVVKAVDVIVFENYMNLQGSQTVTGGKTVCLSLRTI